MEKPHTLGNSIALSLSFPLSVAPLNCCRCGTRGEIPAQQQQQLRRAQRRWAASGGARAAEGTIIFEEGDRDGWIYYCGRVCSFALVLHGGGIRNIGPHHSPCYPHCDNRSMAVHLDRDRDDTSGCQVSCRNNRSTRDWCGKADLNVVYVDLWIGKCVFDPGG